MLERKSTLALTVTNECNKFCETCVHYKHVKRQQTSLDATAVRKAIEYFNNSRSTFYLLAISGGEPGLLKHEEVIGLAEELRASVKDLNEVTWLTNGLLLKKYGLYLADFHTLFHIVDPEDFIELEPILRKLTFCSPLCVISPKNKEKMLSLIKAYPDFTFNVKHDYLAESVDLSEFLELSNVVLDEGVEIETSENILANLVQKFPKNYKVASLLSQHFKSSRCETLLCCITDSKA